MESPSSIEEGVAKGLQIAKRDKEEEADSANGKSPIPFLFKKSPSVKLSSGNGEESRVFGNEFGELISDLHFPLPFYMRNTH